MRIIIAADHPLVRSGSRATLQRRDDNEVVGEASNSQETLTETNRLKPDLLILDLNMPGKPPEELAVELRETLPDLKILVLPVQEDEASIRRLMKVRISGYLLKDEAPENLLQAVRAISQGAAWFSQTVAHRMMGLREGEDRLEVLTPREKQILLQIAQGRDNQTIAKDLSLAEQTVRNYASTIYEKIGVHSRVEAVVWARDNGLV